MRTHLGITCLTAVLACSDGNPVIAPLLDLPAEDSGAFPFDGVDELRLSVARAGEEQSLLEKTFALGEPLALSDVPFGNDLVVHLRGLRGAKNVEVSYGRTCAFDVPAEPDEILVPDPLLYLSRIVTWGPGPSPYVAGRTHGHAFAGSDGSAVLLGGGLEVVSVERLDALVDRQFEPLEAQTEPRVGTVFAEIGEGRGLIVGGVDADGDALPLVELIDPRPDLRPSLQVVPSEGPRLRAHAAASLVDGSAIVIGGETQASDGAAFEVTGEAWAFRLGVADALEAPERLAAELAFARRDHSLTRLGNEVGADVLVVGGRDADGAPVATAELYRPLSRDFEVVEGALLSTPRWSHTAVRMPGGFVLILGGLTENPAGGDPLPVTELELYDPVQGRFAPAGSLPVGAGATELSVTRLPDGHVLLAGGRDASEEQLPVATALIARLDPINGQVLMSPTDSLSSARAGHSAVSLCDGTIVVVGGTSEPGESGAERYNPPSTGRE